MRDCFGTSASAGIGAGWSKLEAPGVSRLRFGRRRDDHAGTLQPGGPRQAGQPREQVERGASGRHHRHRPHALGNPWSTPRNATPTRISLKASPWFTTASSRISPSSKDELAAGGAEFQTETDTESSRIFWAKYRRDGLGRRRGDACHAEARQGRIRTGPFS
ncbi:hypothetical protein F2981_30290 (plasmid) [Sinorhizobium meliloti]|nr:hypothetical protein [Sinorhizobium meliloti]